MLPQKDFEKKREYMGVTWIYCIQTLYFSTGNVAFQQVNAGWTTIKSKVIQYS